jgi:hypothetical protein
MQQFGGALLRLSDRAFSLDVDNVHYSESLSAVCTLKFIERQRKLNPE